MKKVLYIFVGISLFAGLISLKYFTSIFDRKETAIVKEESYKFQKDFSDKKKLSEAVDNIFIGEVMKESGREPITAHHDTQFEIRITQNIKGALLGDITVNQQGGYFKEKGKLYLFHYKGDPMLIQGHMYLFAVSRGEKGTFEMIPKYGHIGLKTEKKKYQLIDEFKSATDSKQ